MLFALCGGGGASAGHLVGARPDLTRLDGMLYWAQSNTRTSGPAAYRGGVLLYVDNKLGSFLDGDGRGPGDGVALSFGGVWHRPR
jgi:hypothetical protein